MLSGTVLITGGAGFLGRGLLRRAQRDNWPCKFVIASRDPQKLAVVKKNYSDIAQTAICDILDTSRLAALMTGCDAVVHAAAMKHLPEAEAQPSAAIRVNVDGTRSVIAACELAAVANLVCVSTDKAAAPMNTYGMTKALVERLVFESLDVPYGDTTLTAVRYGNVIGSTGSIWPLWRQQAIDYKRLTVTDPAMTRFFIGIDDAIDVILAAFQAPAATVVIPTPQALNIGDLAEHLLASWGLYEPNIIGLRPGEKSHEAMLSMAELDHVVLNEDIGYYSLYGPTTPPQPQCEMPGATSDTAEELDPSDFVDMATASESI